MKKLYYQMHSGRKVPIELVNPRHKRKQGNRNKTKSRTFPSKMSPAASPGSDCIDPSKISAFQFQNSSSADSPGMTDQAFCELYDTQGLKQRIPNDKYNSGTKAPLGESGKAGKSRQFNNAEPLPDEFYSEESESDLYSVRDNLDPEFESLLQDPEIDWEFDTEDSESDFDTPDVEESESFGQRVLFGNEPSTEQSFPATVREQIDDWVLPDADSEDLQDIRMDLNMDHPEDFECPQFCPEQDPAGFDSRLSSKPQIHCDSPFSSNSSFHSDPQSPRAVEDFSCVKEVDFESSDETREGEDDCIPPVPSANQHMAEKDSGCSSSNDNSSNDRRETIGWNGEGDCGDKAAENNENNPEEEMDWISRALDISISQKELKQQKMLQRTWENQKDFSRTVYEEAKPGDLLLCLMPVSQEVLETIPPGHERRPYLVVDKADGFLYGYQCSGSPIQFSSCLKNGKKSDKSSDSHIHFSAMYTIPLENILGKRGRLIERLWPEAQKRIVIQQNRQPDLVYLGLDTSWTYQAGDLVMDLEGNLYFVLGSCEHQIQAILCLPDEVEDGDIGIKLDQKIYGMKPGSQKLLNPDHLKLWAMTEPGVTRKIRRLLTEEERWDGDVILINGSVARANPVSPFLRSDNLPKIHKIPGVKMPYTLQTLASLCARDCKYIVLGNRSPKMLAHDHKLSRKYREAAVRLKEAMDEPVWEVGTIFVNRLNSNEWIYLFSRNKLDYGVMLEYYSTGHLASAALVNLNVQQQGWHPEAYASWKEMDRSIRQLYYQYPNWRLSLVWAMEIFETGNAFVWPRSVREVINRSQKKVQKHSDKNGS